MNIKFTNETLFLKLFKATLVKVAVGSRMYGLENERSDRDYLSVYATSDEELNSVFRNHHQFQFVDSEGNDHLFVNLHTFIANIVNGDSVLNFEALHSHEMKESFLGKLYEHRNRFCSLSVVRSYLGRAKKDSKSYDKLKDGNPLTRKKKLVHLMRGLHFAKAILDGSFQLKGGVNRSLWDKVLAAPEYDQGIYATHFGHDVDYVRKCLSERIQYLPQYMTVDNQALIDSLVKELINSEYYKEKKSHLTGFELSSVYESNEKGIVYDS